MESRVSSSRLSFPRPFSFAPAAWPMRRWAVFAAACVLSLPGTLLADCIDWGSFLHVAGQIDVRAHGVHVAGNLGFVTDGSELRIFDLSNPAAPSLLGRIVVPTTAGDLDVAGSYAYVLSSGQAPALAILDVSNPAAPALAGSVALYAWGQRVAVHGAHAYVTSDEAGLWVVDVTNPAAPFITGSVDTPGFAWGVAAAGSCAYVTDAVSYPATTFPALHIVDVTDPAAPRIESSLPMGDVATDVAVAGTHAYVADGYAGVRIVDVSNPAAPSFAGHEAISAGSIALDGTRMYVQWGGYPEALSGFAVLDIPNPSNPVPLGRLENLWGRVAGANGVALMAGLAVEVLDASNPNSPGQLGSAPTRGGCSRLTIAGSLAFAAEWNTGLEIFDLATPHAPASIGFLDTPAFAGDIAVQGRYAYVADSYSGLPSGLLVVDVAYPPEPVLVGRADTPGEALAVEVSGRYAYVADGSRGLVIVDVARPADPRVVGSTATGCVDVALRLPYAYIAAGPAGLVVADVSNPAAPVIAGSVATPYQADALALAWPYAYVLDSGLDVIDVSDPSAPASVARLEMPLLGSIAQEGTHLYVRSPQGLYVIDVADPRAPRIVNNISETSYVSGVAAGGGHVFRLGSDLAIYPPQCSEATDAGPDGDRLAAGRGMRLLVQNPARGAARVQFHLPRPGTAQLRVYDVAGRHVADLAAGFAAAGPHVLTWDGRDGRGRRVPSGVYILRLQAAGDEIARRTALVR